MNVIKYRKYGGPEVLMYESAPMPVPKIHEILIKIYSTSVTQGDVKMRQGKPFAAKLYNGFRKPRKITVLGFELSGVVEKVGSKITKYKVGDKVFAFSGFHFGAYAEYICLPEKGNLSRGMVEIMPDNLSFNDAAVLAGGAITALAQLRKVKLKTMNVMIYGASGSVGTYAVQLAKYFGAAVTGVCSTTNVGLVKSIGADIVVDYTQEDISELKYKYDLVFDAVNKISKKMCKNILSRTGKYISVTSSTNVKAGDLSLIRSIVEDGKLRPVIDKVIEFMDVVEGHRYVELGHKKGNVAIQIIEE